jgi:hypothetical protein
MCARPEPRCGAEFGARTESPLSLDPVDVLALVSDRASDVPAASTTPNAAAAMVQAAAIHAVALPTRRCPSARRPILAGVSFIADVLSWSPPMVGGIPGSGL